MYPWLEPPLPHIPMRVSGVSSRGSYFCVLGVVASDPNHSPVVCRICMKREELSILQEATGFVVISRFT